jgi:hypothetical protein
MQKLGKTAPSQHCRLLLSVPYYRRKSSEYRGGGVRFIMGAKRKRMEKYKKRGQQKRRE